MSVASLSLGLPQSPSRLLSACLQTAGRRQQCSHHLLLSLWAAHSSPVCPVPGHCTALPLDFQLVHSCSLAHWLLRPRGLLWCVWGSGLCSSHLSDSGNHFSTSEERHMNSPEHIPPPPPPQPPRQSRSVVAPKGWFFFLSRSCFKLCKLMQCCQIAQINLEHMNAAYVWHRNQKCQRLKAHWRHREDFGAVVDGSMRDANTHHSE